MSRIDLLSVFLLIITVYLSVCVGRSTTRKTTLVLLLMMCGDIESFPGPQEESLNGFMKSRGLKVFHQNVRGIFTNFVHVQELLDRYKGMDILSLSETHIINSQYDGNDDLLSIDGYKIIKRNRKDRNGGGVAVYLKNNVEWQRRSELERDTIENIWLEVIIPKPKSILLAIFNRPPGDFKVFGS